MRFAWVDLLLDVSVNDGLLSLWYKHFLKLACESRALEMSYIHYTGLQSTLVNYSCKWFMQSQNALPTDGDGSAVCERLSGASFLPPLCLSGSIKSTITWIQASTVNNSFSTNVRAKCLFYIPCILCTTTVATIGSHLLYTSLNDASKQLSVDLILLTWEIFCCSAASSPLIISHSVGDRGRNGISKRGAGVEGL